MESAGTLEPELTEPRRTEVSARRAQRAFSMSMVVSGIRCTLAYIVLPFVTPFIGLAPGVGPGLGLVIGAIAIGANVFSLRRFWRIDHRWKKWVTLLHIGVIAFLLVLMGLDIASLVNQVG